MKQVHERIIQAIIEKAERECQNSLDILGVYGSEATGEGYEKSDLDVMMLINNEQGRVLAKGFILEDTQIGYDLYCTTWEMLENEAKCSHARLTKLLDSKLFYVRNENALEHLQKLQKQASELLGSPERYRTAEECFQNAVTDYGYLCLADTLGEARKYSSFVVRSLLDMMMLYLGKYYRRGISHTFEELREAGVGEDIISAIMDVIRSDTVEECRKTCAVLLKKCRTEVKVKEEGDINGLRGTYEEMVSNWYHKMDRSAEQNDLFSMFMNSAAWQEMYDEIKEEYPSMPDLSILESFEPEDLYLSAQNYKNALNEYQMYLEDTGLKPVRYNNIEEFLQEYLPDKGK